MKRNLVRLIAGSGFAFAALCAGSAAEPVRVAPIRVAPVYGAGLSMPEFTLLPGIALPGWSFRGSSGGMEADADGWRAFRVRTSGKEGAPTLEGRARFLPCPGVENPETKSLTYFDMSGDPLGLAAERAALCLFLRRDLAELPAEYPLVLDEGALRDPRTGAPYCEIPSILWAGWHAKVGSVVESGADAASGVLQPGRLSAALDTTDAKAREDMAALGAAKAAGGAISIDPLAGTFLIDTPRTAGGFAESGAHSAGSVAFTLLPGGIDGDPDGGSATPATVWVSSLDGKPIPESSHMLLTHLTDVQNSGIRYGDPGLTILLGWGGRPHLARLGAAAVSIAVDSGESAGPASFTVYRLDTAGRRVAEVPAKVENGRLDLVARTDNDPSAATILYELVRDDAG